MNTEICIIGSGPGGITLALELAEKGIEVILVESGEENLNKNIQSLSDAIIRNKNAHAPMHQVLRRQLGGTSVIWGGRCVPLDPIDFEKRDYIPNSGWPIFYDDISKFYPRACQYAHCGSSDFSAKTSLRSEQPTIIPNFPEGDILSTTIERWSLPTNFGKFYKNRIKNNTKIKLLTSFTCVELIVSNSKESISCVKLRSIKKLEDIYIKAKYFILACGGLETTRILLNSNKVYSQGIGNQGGKLGLYYMGHISGNIADIKFTTPPQLTSYGFDKDYSNIYCRKRFTISEKIQKKFSTSNGAFWLDNPPIYDPSHKNAILSSAYLALSTPFIKNYLGPEAIVEKAVGKTDNKKIFSHIKNIFFNLFPSILWVFSFLYKRYFSFRKIPGFFVYNDENKYSLVYHFEHIPSEESYVCLAQDKDYLGVRKLDINLKFNDIDIDNIIKAHEILDSYLQKNGCGKLIYKEKELSSLICEQARDGFHQIGTTRMSYLPEDGVVDTNCCVHGINNLYISSSSIFPTSGQGNPTLTIIAFSIRIADHLINKIKK